MRWKWILVIGTILIIALMVTVYVFVATYDYNKLKPQIARMVKDATGRELNLGGEVNLDFGFSPALVVTDVTFANAPWGSQPQMIKVEQLQAQVQLLPLLFEDVQLKKITLVGVDVFLETDRTGRGNWHFPAADSSAKKARSFKVPKIELDQLSIENLHLAYRNGETESTTRFTLAGLDVARQAQLDALTLNLRGAFNDQPVKLSGKTGLIRDLLAHQRFRLKLSGTFSNATVMIDGAIDDVLNLNGIDLKAQASGKNLAKLEFIKNIRLPETSAFDVTGHLKGSKLSLALGDVSGKLSGSGVDVAISGTVGDLIALTDINLQLTGSGKDLAKIGPLIGEKLPVTDDFTVQGRLTGSAKILSLSEAQGSARQGGLSLAADGGIKDLLNFNGLDLVVKGSGKNLSEVGVIIDAKLPATDEFAVEGRLTGSAKALSLKEAQGSAKQGSLSVALSGEVKDLIAFSGLDLQLKGSGKDLSEVGPIIGEKLPATEEFTVKGRLTGSTKVDGSIKNLIALTGIDIKFKGSGRDLAEAGPVIGKKLPTTDKFTTQGRLTGSAKALSLREVKGSVSRGSLNLTFNGGIKELFTFEGISFKLKAIGKELAEIGPLVGTNLPKLGPFDVISRLSGSAKAISSVPKLPYAWSRR